VGAYGADYCVGERLRDQGSGCGGGKPRPYKEQDLLRPDVSVTEAGDVLWVLTSFESFDLPYTGRGLSTDAVADLLTATADRALLR